MATHPNQLAAEANKTHIKRKLNIKHVIDLTKEIKQTNSKMISYVGEGRQSSTCYLTIKLKKLTKCPAG